MANQIEKWTSIIKEFFQEKETKLGIVLIIGMILIGLTGGI